ncbi:Crp/Fnr family transcriptional regulator [Novosphingobium taihuense]|uniref:CRP-like cAMP-binding protein n=1 Tax=Novosphingobium taihuense TaxID=260085 RepID=A0A7W7EW16_9SPHN|nr:Crp/Fnr family transcriptional regulator [Novosphingobium taihuense]MBB4615616.1 CRP-like cAMP-binding protein [Novosphingobium taihuense]TWH82906.1 Crp/Fnr family transcriptional regulator [Novosphingobium taihuense]
MDAATLAEALTAQSLFADCERAELSDIIARGQVRSWKSGQVLMSQGEEGKSLFIVLKGLARVSMVAANGREIILDYAEPGHVLGEIAFLDGGDRTATVEAIDPVEALVLTRGAFAEIIDKHKGLSLRLLKAMARRLRQNNAVIEADRAYTSGPRLARFLLRLMMGDNSDTGNQLKIALSQGELGNFAGMSREQINRQLSAWVDNGIVALKGGRVTILDREALVDVAEAW